MGELLFITHILISLIYYLISILRILLSRLHTLNLQECFNRLGKNNGLII